MLEDDVIPKQLLCGDRKRDLKTLVELPYTCHLCERNIQAQIDSISLYIATL